MNILILCEGKTDAILLSYLLSKESGWKHTKDRKLWNIKEDDKKDESANWYIRDNDHMLICGVGGKTNFKSFFDENLYQPIFQSPDTIDKLIYLIDKDKDSIDDLKTKILADLSSLIKSISIGEWEENSFLDGFQMNKKIDVLSLIIPENEEGALENVLLNSLSEKEYDRNIVVKSEKFVDEIKEEVRDYIYSSRLELKAKLSVVFAIRSPQKVFSLIDEPIKSINWENYDKIKNIFSKILEL